MKLGYIRKTDAERVKIDSYLRVCLLEQIIRLLMSISQKFEQECHTWEG